jgi:Uma2 family endonuclease
MIEVKSLLTPADIEQMMERGQLSADDMFELVNGAIVWLAPAFSSHGIICVLLIQHLSPFAKEIGGLLMEGQTGFKVGEHLQQLRSPDVALISKERLHIIPKHGFVNGAPDLAIEVLSEGQHGEGYARPKIAEYFAAECKVVWFVDEDTRTLREYLPHEPEYRVYSGDAEITLDHIAPGFRCRVSEFFPG